MNESKTEAELRSQDSDVKPRVPFVLVHGAWWGAWSFERLIPLLARRGHAAIARDLPGHGLNARFPRAYAQRPLDKAAFGTEPSPCAHITLDDYVDSVIQTIEDARSLGDGKVVLVGHSMGGIAITAVAERVPEYIEHLVYIAAFMPASGTSMGEYRIAPENEGSLLAKQVMADPKAIGAIRADPRSPDPDYWANGWRALCHDLSEDDYRAVANLMICDQPAAPTATPVITTRERWGSLQRHYIMCLQDQTMRPALQQRFIDLADAFVPQRPTVVHRIDASHAPLLSQPETLADMLAGIAAC
ncbi:alpha/beta hydrolase [Paraburkholderia jirisanensis]